MWSRTEPAGSGAAPARAPLVALGGLVALAALVRAIGLDGGLWIDEIYALVRSFRAPMAAIVTGFWGDAHHPLYSVLARLSLAAFGESAWAVRLPALLFGVAAVPVLYAFGRLVVDRREALLAALVLALNYHHVWFSQNARGYTAIATLTLAGALCLARGLREPDRPRWWLGFGVAGGLAAYTHLTAVFIVAGQVAAAGLALLLARAPRAHWRVAAGGAAAAAAVALALYAPMLGDVVRFFVDRPSQLRGVSTPGWALLELARGLAAGMGGGWLALGALAAALALGLGAAGFVSLARRDRAVALLIAMPVATTVLGALLARGTFYPRFLVFAVVPAALVLVRGVFATAAALAPAARAGRPATAAVLLLVAGSAAALPGNWRLPKQDFAGAMRHVLATRAPGDQVASAGLPDDPYRVLWGQPWPNVTTRAELDSLRRHGRTWLLYTFPRILARGAPEVAAVIRDACPDPVRFPGTVGDGDIRVCLLDAP